MSEDYSTSKTPLEERITSIVEKNTGGPLPDHIDRDHICLIAHHAGIPPVNVDDALLDAQNKGLIYEVDSAYAQV